MKRFLLILLASLAARAASAQLIWQYMPNSWSRIDGGPAGSTIGVTGCDTTPISTLLSCSVVGSTQFITAPTFSAKTFWAGPQSGSAAIPTARSITGSDISGAVGTTYTSSTSTTSLVSTVISTTETTLYSATILGASNTATVRYRMEIWGIWHAETAPPTIRFKAYYGAAALLSSNATAPSSNASDGPFYQSLDLIFTGATNTQLIYYHNVFGSRSVPSTGIGDVFGASSFDGWSYNTGAVDGTADQTFKITVTFGSNAATATVAKFYARLTRYPD